MTRRAAAILLCALAAAVAGLLLVNRTGPPAHKPPRLFRVSPVVPPAESRLPGSAAPTPVQTIRVTLFFPNGTDGKLQPEERDIPRPSGGGAYLKALFEELHKGPHRQELLPSLPDKMALRNAFLLPEGPAVLELAVDPGPAFRSDERRH